MEWKQHDASPWNTAESHPGQWPTGGRRQRDSDQREYVNVVTANNSVTYTIDATNATIEKDNATSTIGSIAVGDDVLVQGSVSGTSVTATSVIDQGAPRTASSTSGSSNGNGGGGGFVGGFMNSIGGFFHHLFGFF